MEFIESLHPFWQTILVFVASGIGYLLSIVYMKISGWIIVKLNKSKGVNDIGYESMRFFIASIFAGLIFWLLYVIMNGEHF